MPQRLPPLTSLRPFEAAARLESFSRAAEEIHVTHGAISHQIKALEEFLGVTLFIRDGKRVKLTEEGKLFAERVRSALLQIVEAAQSINPSQRINRLTISVLPSFAARWLLPRIGRFMELYSEFDVNVQSSATIVNFLRDEVDVAIRFGVGGWPNVQSELLLKDEYFPVCSPRLNRGKLPKRPQDLVKYRLLRSDDEPWTPWFHHVGIDLPEPTSSVFNDASMMLQAAAGGQGIALARRSIVESDLLSGALIRLFKLTMPASKSYYLVWPPHHQQSKKVIVFRDWAKKEIKRKPR